jgi:hypothetical protein
VEEDDKKNMKYDFDSFVRDSLPNKLVSNFIIVAEIVNEAGTELSISCSTSMTPWLASGMLRSAEDMILSGENSFMDEGFSEEEE